jgi:integrase
VGLIVRADGELIDPQTIPPCFDRAVSRTELPPLSVHGLRHPHATLLLAPGVPFRVVYERLGNSTPAFTMATHPTRAPRIQTQAAATFANLLVANVLDQDEECSFYRLPAG